MGGGYTAASRLAFHWLWGSLDTALSLFRMLSSRMKAIFGLVKFYASSVY